jgi:sodium-independent sulfate anion transporter 11
MTDSKNTSPYIFYKKRTFKEKIKDGAQKFPRFSGNYVKALFPITTWIKHYNLTGDIVAGLTAGAVLIPQGMAYAKLAGLPPEYGLYSSSISALIYFPFTISKGQLLSSFFNSSWYAKRTFVINK